MQQDFALLCDANNFDGIKNGLPRVILKITTEISTVTFVIYFLPLTF